jgi:UDP-glucuronate 4-epimerase
MSNSGHVLVTGAAGFIGFHLSKRLLAGGYAVTGIDNLNAYYEVSLKEARLQQLSGLPAFRFHQLDIAGRAAVENLFAGQRFDFVVNLAAQAGVRYSLQNPHAYIDSNINGFLNLLEACRRHPVQHLIYASSSSVYGANRKMPFSVHDNVDHPMALYAASKKANELMAHAYSNLYKIPTTGLRFFTVYGPWGRPDMALFLFTKAILEGKPIAVFNHGNMQRDFTYVDDIVESIFRLIPKPAKPNPDWSGLNPDPGTSFAPYRLFNIGNHQPVNLLHFIEVIERQIGRTAQKNFLPLQDGDVPETHADVEDLADWVDFRPATPIETGVARFIEWYRMYYRV